MRTGIKIVLEQTAPVILQTNHVWDAYGAKIQIDHDFQTLAFLKGYAAIKGARFESITSTEDGGEAGALKVMLLSNAIGVDTSASKISWILCQPQLRKACETREACPTLVYCRSI